MGPIAASWLTPQLDATLNATTPSVIPDYGAQYAARQINTTNYFTYWNKLNLNGTYKIYYSIQTPLAGQPTSSTTPLVAFDDIAFPAAPTSYAPLGDIPNVQSAVLGDGNAVIGVNDYSSATTTEKILLKFYNGVANSLGSQVTAATFTDGLSHAWALGAWGATNYALAAVTYSGTGGANVRITSISSAGVVGASATVSTNFSSIDRLSYSYSSSNANYWLLVVDGMDTVGARAHNTYRVNPVTGSILSTIAQTYVGTVTQEARIIGLGAGIGWLEYWVDGAGLTMQTVLRNATSGLPELGATTTIAAANSVANVSAVGDGRVVVSWRVLNSTADPNNAGATGTNYVQIFDARTDPVNGAGTLIGDTIAGTDQNDTFTHNPGNHTIVGGGGLDTYSMSPLASSVATIARGAYKGVQVTSNGAVDLLYGISSLVFSDTTVNLAAQLYKTGATRDYTGMGTTGALFRNSAGVTYLWTMNGATVTNGATTSVQVDTNWQVKSIADFNGDSAADLLWVYNNASNAADALNGVSYISLQNGAAATGGAVVQQLSSDWQVAGAGDFNGDGMADVLYRSATSGRLFVDIMNGTSINWGASGFSSQDVTDAKWSVAAVGDFNGDGKSDLLWRYYNAGDAGDALNGTLYEWTMNGLNVASSGLLSQQASGNWQVAGSGDFNGDGNADLLFRYNNASNAADALNGITYIDFLNGANVLGSSNVTAWQVDNNWAVASIGDFNGDYMSDILWQNVASGSTYLWTMNGANVAGGATTSAQAGAGWTVQNGALIS